MLKQLRIRILIVDSASQLAITGGGLCSELGFGGIPIDSGTAMRRDEQTTGRARGRMTRRSTSPPERQASPRCSTRSSRSRSTSRSRPRPKPNLATSTKLKVRIKRFHGVAKWTWGVSEDEDDVCIICQGAYEGVAPGVKHPGDECPVVWGRCGHAFHLVCVQKWLQSQTDRNPNSAPTCPTCRQEWEYAAR